MAVSIRFIPRRSTSWSLLGSGAVSLLLGWWLVASSAVTAQPDSPSAAAISGLIFPATGYRITQPDLVTYFQHRGGVRTFGLPISSEFQLLGRHVQLFQRQVLELQPDGSVAPLNTIDGDLLPVTRFDGLTLPRPDPDLISGAPSPRDPAYLEQALVFIDGVVPDQWNGRDVNFHATFLASVTCGDAFGDAACDASLLPAFALEIWGLPTSRPAADPNNADFVYQRFQRGIMHYSASTGLSQGLLLGDWFKRVLMGGSEVPADARAQLSGSRFFGQYALSRPLSLARPVDLPDTSLVSAFNSDTLVAAQATATESAPPGVVATASAVAATATAVGATQIALQSTQVATTATAVAATQTASAVPGTPGTLVPGTPAVQPPPAVPPALLGTPVTNVGCLGDEQMWFTPRKPYVGTHVDIAVTSQRHHDVRVMRLTGPLDAGLASERSSTFGWTFTWTVAPTVEGFHNWTFYADGLRPCITSGFPALPALGATATPTITPQATATPNPTGTVTPTPTPGVPSITGATSSGSCGDLVTINGTNFGSPPSQTGTQVFITGQGDNKTLTLLGGSNTTLSATLPTVGVHAGAHNLLVSSNSGVSNSFSFTVTAPGCP